MNRISKAPIAALFAGIAAVLLMFAGLHWLYINDNKYTAGPPYGSEGILICTGDDLSQPLFLVDGWELYPDAACTPEDFSSGKAPVPQYTFMGQNSGFIGKEAPFGTATYRLRIRMEGPPVPVSLEIPELFTHYTLWVNGQKTASGKNGFPQIDTVLDGELELILNIENHTHYYSGMYYPPAIGYPAVIARMGFIRTVFYMVLCVSTLTLALFSAVLWALQRRESLFLHFGLFCLFYCITCLHPFIWQAGLSGRFWYALEDASRLAMLSEAIWIGTLITGLFDRPLLRRILTWTLPSACLICAVFVGFIIPFSGKLINGYGRFIDSCSVAGWLWLCFCAAWGISRRLTGSWFIFAAVCFLGAGFLVNLLNNNRFEPIYTGWQIEYAGFFMVLIFGTLMVQKNHEILETNRRLSTQMESLIEERTNELSAILEERKNFFSDMAHNLKAPIAAVHGFITLIREQNLYLDEELQEYIGMIEAENEEIHQRVQSLTELNAYDRITSSPAPVPVNLLLENILINNEPDAAVAGIHLCTGKLADERIAVFGQWEKLLILFENMIYNSIIFTPEGGSITITPTLEEADIAYPWVRILVTDTGCGIAPEHLPHIFERFYTSRRDSTGSGLGLYIVNMIVDEMGGTIRAKSEIGEGAAFEIRLPARRI